MEELKGKGSIDKVKMTVRFKQYKDGPYDQQKFAELVRKKPYSVAGAIALTKNVDHALWEATYPLGGGMTLYLQFQFTKAGPSGTFEFNVGKACDSSRARLREILEEVFAGGGVSLVQHGRVRYYELAYDFPGLQFGAHFCLNKHTQISSYDLTKDGTTYLGAFDSACGITMYDKRKQMLENKPSTDLGYELLRVEHRSEPRIGLAEIAGLANPFRYTQLLSFENLASAKGGFRILTLKDDILHKKLDPQSAYRRIAATLTTTTERSKFWAAVSSLAINAWKPGDMWAEIGPQAWWDFMVCN